MNGPIPFATPWDNGEKAMEARWASPGDDDLDWP